MADTFGERVRSRREHLRISQRDLAKRAGLKAHSGIARIEQNQSTELTLDMTIRLAAALEYPSVVDLVRGTDVGERMGLSTEDEGVLLGNVRAHLGHLSPEEQERAWLVLRLAFGRNGIEQAGSQPSADRQRAPH